MTDQELVLAAYPDARIVTYQAGEVPYVVISTGISDGSWWLFDSPDHITNEEDAWNDAAIAVKHEMIRRLSE